MIEDDEKINSQLKNLLYDLKAHFKDIRLLKIVDQMNVIENLKKEISSIEIENYSFCKHQIFLTILSGSSNNENANSIVNFKILEYYDKWKELDSNLLLKKSNINLEKEEFGDFKEITNLIPLNEFEFILKYNNNITVNEKFKIALKNYVYEKQKNYESSHKKFFESIKYDYDKKNLLQSIFKSHFKNKIDLGENYIIDKQLMYIEDDYIHFIDKVAENAVVNFHIKNSSEKLNENFFSPEKNILENENHEQKTKGNILEYVIKILIKIEKKFCVSKYKHLTKDSIENVNEKLELNFKDCITANFFGNNLPSEKYVDNVFLFPINSNYPSADFFIFDKNKKIFYVFKVTINVCSHQSLCTPDFKLKKSLNTNDFIHNAAKKWKDYFSDLKEIKFFWITPTNEKEFDKVNNEKRDDCYWTQINDIDFPFFKNLSFKN